ncbi:hypothetical protein GGR40_000215 [Novosphingobium gossypii]
MTTPEKGGECAKKKVVRMYPNNQLREQVRDFSETLCAFDVIAGVVHAEPVAA